MPHKCEIAGCGKPHLAKGYCSAHYGRLRKYGDPEGVAQYKFRKPGTAIRWLLDHVDWQDRGDCLLWPFNRGPHGYGRVRYRGKEGLASRAMCTEAHGEPPTPDHEAAHSCGRGADGCINPNHLSWKTIRENEADKVVHGTLVSGERSNLAKLTEADVSEIKALLADGRLFHREIAARFGVCRQTIDCIANGKAWKASPIS